jgi:hypothetical protein
MLADAMAADIGPSGLATSFSGTGMVSLETPREMRDAGQQGLSISLYLLERDEQWLNDPPLRAGGRGAASRPAAGRTCRRDRALGSTTDLVEARVKL